MTDFFKEIQAVAFDLDGTLVDSIPDLANSANVMREQMGLERLPEDLLCSFVGDGLGALVHRSLAGEQDGVVEQDIWEQGFSLFVAYYAQHLTDHTHTYPNVADTLGILKTRQYTLAVITNKSERFASQILKKLGLMDYLSILIGGDTLPEKKPSPLPLLHVAERFNIQPNKLLMVGDSRNDIIASKQAGCAVVGVDYGYANMHALQENSETQANIVISNMANLLDYLPQCPR